MPDSSAESKTASGETRPVVARLVRQFASRHVKRGLRWLGIWLVVFGLLGYFGGPPLVRHVATAQLAKALHREVTLGSVDINPYALSVRIRDLSVLAAPGQEQLGLGELYVNLSSFSLFQAGIVIDAVQLNGLRVAVRHVGEGKYDISDLLDEWLKPSDSPTPRFSVNNIEVQGASLRFEDGPKQQTHRVDDIQLSLPFISSLPYQAEIVVAPHFSAMVDGAKFELRGQMLPFSPTHTSEIALDLDQFDLARLAPYLPASLPVRLLKGKLDTALKLAFSQPAGEGAQLSLLGQLELAGLQLNDAAGGALLALERITVPLEGGNLAAGQLHVGEVLVTGPQLSLAVSKAGVPNWQALLAPSGAAKSAKPGAKPNPPLHWSLAGLHVDKGQVQWRDESGDRLQVGTVQDLALQVGAVESDQKKPLVMARLGLGIDFGDALRIRKIALSDSSIDLGKRELTLGSLQIQAARLLAMRDASGSIQWLLPPRLKAAESGQAESAPAWKVALKKLDVGDVTAEFEDRSLPQVSRQKFELLSLSGQDIGSEGKAGRLSAESRINGGGKLSMGGQLNLQPLLVEVALDAQAISLLPFQPYFAQFLNATLARGQVSAKGQVRMQAEREGLKGGYTGSLTLGDMLLVDKANSADFLKWKSLYLGGMDVRLSPNSLHVGEISLADFYSRLIVNPEGTLNLTQIIRRPEASATPAGGESASAKAEPMPISVGKVSLQGGAVEFSDRFVKPNFSVSLSRLGGRIAGFSTQSGSLADMELRGSYANMAPVQVTGRLNPLAARQALDVQAEIRGVDLVGFSPYSGKYAGYDIEKGKLSLFLKYKLKDGKLEAENRVFLDQLTFGDKVDSPSATSLPVRLAVALLKNSRGEIDINLPISGSLDDPQFSMGGVIVKVVVNLFVKAVTSPFALLGSLFGDSEELSFIEFEAGQTGLSAASIRRLESLAKALNDRSGLRLEIGGHVDPDHDREGLKRVLLERAVRAEKLKELVRKGIEGASVDSVQMTAAEYPVYLKKAYGEARFPKPRNLLGLEKDLPVEEMEKLMLTHLSAGPDTLRALAEQRAAVAQGWLVEQGKVAPERIFLTPPKSDGQEASEASSTSGQAAKKTPMRADFALR